MGSQVRVRMRQPFKHPVQVTLVIAMLVVAVGDLFFGKTMGSEFPERECCDTVYPIPAPPGPAPPGGHGHGMDPPFPEHPAPQHSTPPTVTTEIPGAQTKAASAIMNCIQARDSCMNNTACHPILEVVPRVCGAEKVACSTVTITKCQAALRTLQAFPYFFPTCLCREPMSDPACNTFRDYLFDHPCSFVKAKERDPYPVDALPTCDYAHDVCKKEPKCIQLLKDFKKQCKQSEDHQCKMEDGELCHDAWTKLRLSPIFGCICPNGLPKCDRIFREVNYNPCVASDPALELNGSTSALFSLDQHRLSGLSHHMSFSPAALFPPKPGTHLHNHYEAKFRHYQHRIESNAIDTTHEFPEAPPRSRESPRAPSMPNYPIRQVDILPAARTESQLMVDESLSTPISYHGYPSPGSFSTSHSGSITVQVSSSHAPDHELESQLETPLYAPQSGHGNSRPPPFVPSKPKYPDDRRLPQQPGQPQPRGAIATISSIRTHGSHSERSGVRIPLQATCLTALQNCRRNPACYGLLEQVLHYCDPMRCRQETCMKALQKFYREVESQWALDVAFCMCRKTDNRHDQCRLAQEQLHPVCAQRGDLGVNPPSCHSLAENCRAEVDCRFRLEEYEQACAVDSVTRKCAGPTIECRSAMIRILGTKLRTSCACNGTDFTQLYDCLGWQRILWVNPCVVESQRDYHRLRVTQAPASVPQRSTTTLRYTPTDTDTSSPFEGVLPGGDVLSTTMGNPPPAPRPRNGVTYPTHTIGYTTTHSSPSTSRVTTVHTRHPNSKTHTNGYNHKPGNNGGRNGHNPRPNPHEVSPYSTSNNNNGPYDFSTVGNGTLLITDETSTITTTTGKTEPTTTLQPPRYCPLRQPKPPDQKIREGQSKRLYREDIPTCSELCVCELGRLEWATCTVLECLEIKHCYVKTEDEYTHLQPTYIAHRGNCKCYAGRFICEKPPPDTYTLENGVFLFIGFSSRDEQVLRPHTRLGVRDVVDALRQLITPQTQHYFFDSSDPEETAGLEKLMNLNATDCRLGLYKVEGENIIINATIFDEDYSEVTMRQPNDQLFNRERKQCLPVLQVLKELINKQHPIIHSHTLLSILKLATVQDNIPTPEPNSASRSTQAALSSSLFVNAYVFAGTILSLHVALAHLTLLMSRWTCSQSLQSSSFKSTTLTSSSLTL